MAPTRLMGIVNVTPDSFSGDGVMEPARAVERGLAMARAGAALVDVGGESTRPGHTPVPAAEEIRRVVPVIRELAGHGVTVSVDTSKLDVAEAAADAGAAWINDVWGLQRSPAMAGLARERGLGLILMHNQDGTHYAGDIIDEMKRSLRRSVEVAERAGVPSERIVIDPGIGFGKTAVQNVTVLQRLEELHELRHPILVGVSRKSFLERVFGLAMPERIWGTAAAVAVSVMKGAAIVRVHDVHEMSAVVRVAEAMSTVERPRFTEQS
jgi:dihydropteroate synthase